MFPNGDFFFFYIPEGFQGFRSLKQQRTSNNNGQERRNQEGRNQD